MEYDIRLESAEWKYPNELGLKAAIWIWKTLNYVVLSSISFFHMNIGLSQTQCILQIIVQEVPNVLFRQFCALDLHGFTLQI